MRSALPSPPPSVAPPLDRIVERLAERIAAVPIDSVAIPQAALDLTSRERTSLFPWRGQFSPQLVELLLSHHARPGALVVDPFVGSGTTLFEAGRGDMDCYGSEINQAALHFASLARFGAMPKDARRAERALVERAFERHFGPLLPSDLFRRPAREDAQGSTGDALRAALSELDPLGLALHALAAAALLAMGDGPELTPRDLEQSLGRVWRTIDELPASDRACTVLLRDARLIALPPESADVIVTSPPYVNVFNYHQNYRKSVEMMGADVLRNATSEIGANRKFRQNRVLTVIQYALDMSAALAEMRRVLKRTGVAVLVVGRESRVCGLRIENGRLLAMLAVGGAGFHLARWQERVFTNRFGEPIREDVLTLVPATAEAPGREEFARNVALHMLRQLSGASEEARDAVAGAIARAAYVEPSPLLVRTGAASGRPSRGVGRRAALRSVAPIRGEVMKPRPHAAP